MKKFAAGFVKKRGGEETSEPGANSSPEDSISREVKLFCESGGPNDRNDEGQEYLRLPTIVEAAESSPTAAKAAAYQIRKVLKENYQKPYCQYNAIMLIRILTDNPGRSFTKNMDEKFIYTVQMLLQKGSDPSVHQLLSETLHSFEIEKAFDENLVPLMAMWQKEKSMVMQKQSRTAPVPYSAIPGGSRPPRQRGEKKLPSPAELSGRIEEGRMSAQLLMQVTQSTSPAELVRSGLAREFADRCQTAQRNLQGYMNCTNPAPEERTFQTLIETCEQLNVALSKHQRAILAARRETMSQSPAADRAPGSPPPILQPHPRDAASVVPAPQQQPPPPASRNPYYTLNGTPQAPLYPPNTSTTSPRPASNPFSDANQVPATSGPGQRANSGLSNRQTYSNPSAPATGIAELPLSNTPPLGPTVPGPIASIPSSQMLDDDDFHPPRGPPPNRQSTFPLRETAPSDTARPPTQDSDDLYSSNSPVADTQYQPGSPPRRQGSVNTNPFTPTEPPFQSGTAVEYESVQPPPAPQPQLQSSPNRTQPPPRPAQSQSPPMSDSQLQSKPTYIPRQDAATGSPTMSGGASRIKDDEPMTPMSADAWQSGRY